MYIGLTGKILGPNNLMTLCRKTLNRNFFSGFHCTRAVKNLTELYNSDYYKTWIFFISCNQEVPG